MSFASYRALAGAQCISDACQERQARLPDGGQNIAPGPVIPPSESRSLEKVETDTLAPEPHIGKVGILGAGAAGLYAAMILESFGIECVIHEAGPKPGGRLYTHYFDKEQDPTKYQYYDVGAMRYPVIPIMERTFDLFRRVGFTENDRLIKYYMTAKDDNTPLLYNHKRFVGSDPPGEDYFHVSMKNGGTVPDKYVTKEGTGPLTKKAFEEYKTALAKHWQTGWHKLMYQDLHSTRAYMSQSIVIQPAEPRVEGGMNVEVKRDGQDLKAQVVSGLNYPFDVIQWCETMDSATGLYEQAFSESVMDSLDFGWPSASREGGITTKEEAMQSKWVCIDGGGSTLIQSMLKKIPKTKIIYNSRVTGIRSDQCPENPAVTKAVIVTAVDSTAPKTDEEASYVYDQVLSSLPLSVLSQTVNTSHAGLDYQQTNAIRALHYDCSVKVGIRFKKQWWRLPPYNITGGTASTDRPLRTCVYPSYGLDKTEPDSPGVLLASYTWAQDATRLGALVQGSNYVTKKYPEERELIDLMFRDLAALHDMPDEKVLRKLYMDHYAHNWFDDPNATGAFALFGAGQFSKMYPALSRPAAYNRRLHLIGEATSVHHAWVVGALNSAWRGVYNLLRTAGCKPHDSRIKRLKQRPCLVTRDGEPCEPCDDRNWGPIPEEMGRILNEYEAPLQPVTRPIAEPSDGVGGAPRGAPRPPPADLPRAPPTYTQPPGYFIPAPGQSKKGEEWWESFTPGRYSLEV